MKTMNEDSIHTPCGLTDDGDVYTWGYNGYGEVGDGRTQNAYGPKRIPREFFNDALYHTFWRELRPRTF